MPVDSERAFARICAPWIRLTGGAVLALMLCSPAMTVSASPTPRVLLLSADPHTSPGLLEAELEFRRALTSAIPDAEVDVEHLDLVYLESPELRAMLFSFLRAKYSERVPDVVVALGIGTVRLLLAERETTFPRSLLMAGHVQRGDLATIHLPTDVPAVVSDWDFASQVEVVLRLLPRTRRVIAVLGSGSYEKWYEPQFRRDFEHYADRVEIEWWVGVPMRELEARLGTLPPNTAVIYLPIYRDDSGERQVPVLALERLSRSSKAPIFSSVTHHVGVGAVGDGHVRLGAHGAQLGAVATRLLRGEKPETIGIVDVPAVPPRFDARLLDRYGIPQRLLPSNSEVMFARPSIWDEHRGMLIGGIVLIVLQAGLLAALLAQRLARRRAEHGALESRSLHKAVVDSLDERIATIDRDGTIVAANRAWLDFAAATGATVPLGIGANYLSIVRRAIERGQDDARRTTECLTAVLSGRENSRRVEYFSPAEGEGWRYEMRIVSLQAAGSGAIVTIQDVTDRWQSEERVRVTLESLPVATILLDADRRIELVNAEAERLFGYHRGELLGRSLRLVIPDFRASSPELLEKGRGLKADADVVDRNVTGRRKDNTEVPIHIHLQGIAMGTRRMLLASIADLTERRRLDAEMQRLREETVHFGRVAAVGEISAAIAHELNQPLTGIMTNCQAAQLSIEHGTFSKEDIAETIGDILADTRRAGEVIQRLRLMLRKAPIEAHILDLNEMVQQVMRLVAHDLALRGTSVDLQLTEDLPRLSGDRIHLQQVILNLILNGADAMADLPAEQRRMLLRTARGMNHTVELELRDAGPGISPEAMPHLFEPFFTTKATGMGMGLSIVRSIVDAHSGRIGCANAASGGAVFTVSLPAVTGKEAA